MTVCSAAGCANDVLHCVVASRLASALCCAVQARGAGQPLLAQLEALAAAHASGGGLVSACEPGGAVHSSGPPQPSHPSQRLLQGLMAAQALQDLSSR